MKLRKTLTQAALVASLALASMGANAALIVQDGWQLDSNGSSSAGNLTTGIGHLVVSGGQATITQELNGLGQVFQGARFTEFGGLYSLTYTPENCVGGCDSGAPGVLAGGTLTMGFTGLKGSIATLNSDGSFTYKFDPGVGSMWLNLGATQIATFAMASPSGGTLANFFGAVNTSGTSNILLEVLSSITGLFPGLDAAVSAGDLFLAIDMTNQIFKPATAVQNCAISGALNCSQLVVTSQGKVDELLRIPEPTAISLFGLGLLGLAFSSRRKQQ